MQINIINKAKTAGITLFALMWVVFASTTPVQTANAQTKGQANSGMVLNLGNNKTSKIKVQRQSTSVGEHYVVTNAKTSTTGGQYAVVNADGSAKTDSKGNKLYANSVVSSDGTVTPVRRLEKGTSKVFREQPNPNSSSVTARQKAGDVINSGLESFRQGVNNTTDKIHQGLTEMANDGNSVTKFVANYVAKPLLKAGQVVLNGATYAVEAVNNVVLGQSNAECNQGRMDAIYKSGCYPCKVIKTLISSFMNGITFLQDVSVRAGTRILLIGFLLWIAFYIMQQVSSFKDIEPRDMVNNLLIMAFKVLGAYYVIQLGFQIFVDFVVVPFLGWGIDFGTYLLTATTSATGLDISGNQVGTEYLMTNDSGNILPAHLLNNLMTYVGAVDGTTTNHMKLGHMIICHSTHQGAWNIGILIPNVWIWLCGAFIWFFGFMMTLSILYYLVDMSFKLGFALVALPIVTGLWPFNITRGKFSACIKIILEAAGIFIFLAMTSAVGLVLVNSAIGAGQAIEAGGATPEAILQQMENNTGINELYASIEAGDNEKISDTFMLWGSCFILIVFAYLYALKIIGSTMKDYVSVFFNGGLGGSPMHHMLTQATDMVKQKAVAAGKYAKDVVKHQSKLGLQGMASKFGGGKDGDKSVMDKAEDADKKLEDLKKGKFDGAEEEAQSSKKKDSADQIKGMTNLEAKDNKKPDDPNQGKDGGKGSGAAQAMEAAGDGLTEAGQAIEQQSKAAADATRQAGNAVDAAGMAGAVPTVGTTAGVGKTVQATTETSAAAIETTGKVAGEVLKTAGKALKQGAKIVKKTEQVANKAASAAKKAAQTAQKGMEKIEQKINQGSQGSEQQSGDQNQQNQGNRQGNDDFVSSVGSAAINGNKK
mgnify:FL=1